MTAPIFITAPIVAEMIGFDTATTFLDNRERLQEQSGFPAPMPTYLRPLKWRRDAVEAWLEQCQLPASAVLTGTNVVLLNAARQA